MNDATTIEPVKICVHIIRPFDGLKITINVKVIGVGLEHAQIEKQHY